MDRLASNYNLNLKHSNNLIYVKPKIIMITERGELVGKGIGDFLKVFILNLPSVEFSVHYSVDVKRNDKSLHTYI